MFLPFSLNREVLYRRGILHLRLLFQLLLQLKLANCSWKSMLLLLWKETFTFYLPPLRYILPLVRTRAFHLHCGARLSHCRGAGAAPFSRMMYGCA